MNQPSSPPGAPVLGAWSPLSQPTFRNLWLAVLAGNIGTWIHDVSAAWVMAETTGSPFMVAAVQSATTLPVVLLAVLAGTLADIVDRRKYLILAQLWMLLVASTLAVLAHLDMLGPWTLITLTFALGIGGAMALPAQQATVPEMVPKSMLSQAVALSSLSMNIARAVGPALGGLIVANAGIQWAFAINALSFLGVAIVLVAWRRTPSATTLPPESFGVALRAGLRYATQASVLQSVLVKAASFFVFASALTALLPIVVNRDLQASAGTYGLLLGCIGIGAISGALLLPKLRARIDPDRMVLIATLVYAGCMLALALLRNVQVLFVVSLVNGFAWITVLSSLQIAAQTSVPAWVRARALSLYIVVFSGGMAIGSLGWGTLAQQTSTTTALLIAAAGTVVAALFGVRYRLGEAARVNVTPSGHWPQPVLVDDVAGDRGPVLITIEYRIALDHREEFLALMQALGRSRRRDGAVQWGVAEDTEVPGTYLEYFLDGSWLEHLRQHERVTEGERVLQEQILALLSDPTVRPHVRHFVGGNPGAPLKTSNMSGGKEMV
ncbi:MFS transporter [Pseudoxanthomonas sp. PXM02]|uniref:MFS transporter n=1 Tax=Pseudoxanthomonas sp. PXM02 TaxID=2769294 RepID=UPI00177BFF87|nr:MFS transporter [Pseudoxanthomonas sp. PXM02]MBD9477897.1 MFS transporter [Pseudoxanthomonas sp. PXM02]